MQKRYWFVPVWANRENATLLEHPELADEIELQVRSAWVHPSTAQTDRSGPSTGEFGNRRLIVVAMKDRDRAGDRGGSAIDVLPIHVGDEAFVVDAVHVAELGLKSGMPVEGSRVERLRRLAQLTGLKERALHLLAHRPYTEHELRCRLQQGDVTPECVDEVLDWLRSLGYVDDAAFARRWVEVRRQTKGFGPVRLRHELVERV